MTFLPRSTYSEIKRLVKSKSYQRVSTQSTSKHSVVEHYRRVVKGEYTNDCIIIIKRKTGVSVFTDITHIIKEELL